MPPKWYRWEITWKLHYASRPVGPDRVTAGVRSFTMLGVHGRVATALPPGALRHVPMQSNPRSAAPLPQAAPPYKRVQRAARSARSGAPQRGARTRWWRRASRRHGDAVTGGSCSVTPARSRARAARRAASASDAVTVLAERGSGGGGGERAGHSLSRCSAHRLCARHTRANTCGRGCVRQDGRHRARRRLLRHAAR